MALPEQEIAVLTDSIYNIQIGHYGLFKQIAEIINKVADLHGFVQVQQRLPAPGDLQQALNDIIYSLDGLLDSRKPLQDHAQNARNVVDAFSKRTFTV